jgi:predicted amino acid racemase
MNMDALRHNARQVRRLAGRWGLSVLPVLKAVASHPAAVAALTEAGAFTRFGCAEAAEADQAGLGPAGRCLIQLTALSRVRQTAETFQRSFQAVPEVLAALNQATAALGRKHEVVLMVDLDDEREGVNPEDLPELLDYARTLPHLTVKGFGATTTCLGHRLPDQRLADDLRALRSVFAGGPEPEISLGGTVWAAWVDQAGPGVITELRLGDPFILGEDIYRQTALPGGPFRTDVCRLEAEVLEIRTRRPGPGLNGGAGPAGHVAGLPEPPDRPRPGQRRRALLDLGRFHSAADLIQNGGHGDFILSGLNCRLPGAFIAGISAGYLVLDITDCAEEPRVGQTISFKPSYWSIAEAFRNWGVLIKPAFDPEEKNPESARPAPAFDRAGNEPAHG